MPYLRGRLRKRHSFFEDRAEAFQLIRDCTDEDSKDDVDAWGGWLRHNRRVYHHPPAELNEPSATE